MGMDLYTCGECGEAIVGHWVGKECLCGEIYCDKCFDEDNIKDDAPIWDTGKVDDWKDPIYECKKCTENIDKLEISDYEVCKLLLKMINKKRTKNPYTYSDISDMIRKHKKEKQDKKNKEKQDEKK